MNPGKSIAEKYLLTGGIAIFFILIIALAAIFYPSSVGGELLGLGHSFAGPFLAFAHGVASIFVTFFENLWKLIYNNTIGRL